MGIFNRYTEEEKTAITKARKIKSLEQRQQDIRELVEGLRNEQRKVVAELEQLTVTDNIKG
jgi:hypothetical protein